MLGALVFFSRLPAATAGPLKQWRVGREFNRRLKKEFDRRGIEIPFQHRTVYMGIPKTTAPFPLHIVVHQASNGGALRSDPSRPESQGRFANRMFVGRNGHRKLN